MELKAIRDFTTDATDASSLLLGESVCYCDLGRFDEAAEVAFEAVRLLPEESPGRPYAEFCLAVVREHEGQFDLAVQGFRAILKRYAELLSTTDYTQLGQDGQFRLIASLIVLGHAVEPLSIANALGAEDITEKKGQHLRPGKRRRTESWADTITLGDYTNRQSAGHWSAHWPLGLIFTSEKFCMTEVSSRGRLMSSRSPRTWLTRAARTKTISRRGRSTLYGQPERGIPNSKTRFS